MNKPISKKQQLRIERLAAIKKAEENKANHIKKLNDTYASAFKDRIYTTWKSNNDTNYVIHVGKTGSGKTYQALERLKEVGSGVYLAPLRLLAWEIYDNLNSNNYRCSLVTGEEQIISNNAHFTACTIEMLNYSKEHEMLIVDEAFMIGDKERGKSWLKAILSAKAKEIHIITNDESLHLITNILNKTDKKHTVKRHQVLQEFKFKDNAFGIGKKTPNRGVFVTFSRIDVLVNKLKLENLGKKVSILYGNLPPEVKKIQISDFVSGKTDVMVCTDVIGMGINVPCDYLVFLKAEKYDGVTNRMLNSIEIKQIAGRTGRYGLSNSDSFVSAVNQKDLNYIKKQYLLTNVVNKAYIGLDYEMFCSFHENMTIAQRIKSFQDIDFIPDSLKDVVSKESTTRYFEVADIIEREKFDIDTVWAFLTAPVKYNNKYYFSRVVSSYKTQGKIITPTIHSHYNDAKDVEDIISEVELYLNMTRNLNHDSTEKEQIIKDKEILIDKLTQMLLDKKLNKKKCKSCSTMLSILSPHNYCDNCHRDYYQRNRWDDDDDWLY
jgi:ATP-dependent RNA helicase SUPV3L1/SUV3